MDDQRKRVLIIVVAVLVLLGILAFLFRPKQTSAPSETTQSTTGSIPVGSLTQSGGLTTDPGAPSAAQLPPPLPPTEAAVQQLAMTFAERYGSFSTEGNYVNLEDLYSIMTERYRRATEADVAARRAAGAASTFASETALVLSTSVTLPSGEDSTSASVRVTTQRQMIFGGSAPQTSTQDIVVELLKTSEGWRVDRATWDE